MTTLALVASIGPSKLSHWEFASVIIELFEVTRFRLEFHMALSLLWLVKVPDVRIFESSKYLLGTCVESIFLSFELNSS